MRNTASGTHAHTPNSPRFTPGPWRSLGHRIIVAECQLVADETGKDLIPNRLLDQACAALKLSHEGRK